MILTTIMPERWMSHGVVYKVLAEQLVRVQKKELPASLTRWLRVGESHVKAT